MFQSTKLKINNKYCCKTKFIITQFKLQLQNLINDSAYIVEMLSLIPHKKEPFHTKLGSSGHFETDFSHTNTPGHCSRFCAIFKKFIHSGHTENCVSRLRLCLQNFFLLLKKWRLILVGIPFQISCQNSPASLVYLLSYFSLRIPTKLASLRV